jgi:hypothetical protein
MKEGPFEVGNQVLISSHRERLGVKFPGPTLRIMVTAVAAIRASSRTT